MKENKVIFNYTRYKMLSKLSWRIDENKHISFEKVLKKLSNILTNT
jgi:hypothetical protein